MNTDFSNFILNYPGRLAMPIGVYAGLEMTGASVRHTVPVSCREAVSNPVAQSQAVLALHRRFHTPVMLTAMDLSAEAEAFGCTIRMPEDEIPTVTGRLVTDLAGVQALPVPAAGSARTAVHLEACRLLAAQSNGAPVLGGLIGPFSLAGRLFGVSEALEATISDPDTVLVLLDKVTRFLSDYAAAFKRAGAAGVIMAEPAAGLLSPRGLGRFSAPFVRRIIEAAQDERFTVILHNCGAKLVHLPKVLESGAEIYHFGAPMDILAALDQVDGQAILCGNLDPSAVFHGGTPGEMRARVSELLAGVVGSAGGAILCSPPAVTCPPARQSPIWRRFTIRARQEIKPQRREEREGRKEEKRRKEKKREEKRRKEKKPSSMKSVHPWFLFLLLILLPLAVLAVQILLF